MDEVDGSSEHRRPSGWRAVSPTWARPKTVLPGGDVTGQGPDGRTDFDKKNDGHGTAMAARGYPAAMVDGQRPGQDHSICGRSP